MRNKREIALLAIVFTSILVALYFDASIVRIISLIRTNFLNSFFLGITFVSSEIIIFFLLTSLFLWSKNKRKWILPLWLTLFLSAVVAFLLKVMVQRPRPFQLGIVSTLPTLMEKSFTTWNFSFPSFQAMLAFCAIPILIKEFPKLKYAWILFAVLVAFSRVYFGLHFLSDVIVGGLIGYLIGTIVIKYEKESRICENIYRSIFR